MRDYFDYHLRMMAVGDIDPQNLALRYICNRFELNLEQRYWLAFLFGCTYCAPTVYYIYNEFPDFENVDVDRLERWWQENKKKCLLLEISYAMTINPLAPGGWFWADPIADAPE